jgi:hypothetical protein
LVLAWFKQHIRRPISQYGPVDVTQRASKKTRKIRDYFLPGPLPAYLAQPIKSQVGRYVQAFGDQLAPKMIGTHMICGTIFRYVNPADFRGGCHDQRKIIQGQHRT